MKVTVEFPAGVHYPNNPVWFIDPKDGWTIGRLCDDVCYAARAEGLVLKRGGIELGAGDIAADVLADGDVISLSER